VITGTDNNAVDSKILYPKPLTINLKPYTLNPCALSAEPQIPKI